MEFKDLKIKSIKLYQSVQFEQTEVRYFNSSTYEHIRRDQPGYQKQNIPEVTLTRLENGGVLIRSGKDIAEVGPANIAAISYFHPEMFPSVYTPSKTAVKKS